MLRTRALPATLALFLFADAVAADKVPGWTAPRSWTSPRAANLERVVKSRPYGTMDIEGIEALPTGPLPFFGITPCRIVDTRNAPGPFGGPALIGNATRTFNLPSAPCGVPSIAGAYSLNLTIIGTSGLQGGFLTAWPTGESQPTVSTLNFNASEVVANAAVVPAGTNGSINVFVNIPGHLLIDINGYYAPAGIAGAKTVAVDCTVGQKIQAAIDREEGPLVVDVHGICDENVSIVRKNVTLRGVDPLTDGIDGVVAVPQFAALRLRYVESAQVQNLTIRNGPLSGISAAFSTLVLQNSRITGHAGQGISATQGSIVDATGVTISQNGGAGVNVQTASRLFCHECDVTGNTGFAAVAMSGSVVSLLNSVVTGVRGLQSFAAYVDIDCVTETSAHACGLNMTGRAALAGLGGVAAFFGGGDFTGQVEASDSGTIHILGARQLATGQPGLGPAQNSVDGFGKLIVAEESGMQSQLFGTTNVSGFGRALLRDETTLAGSIQCGSAGDAWLDPTVIAGPGAAVNGCEHGTLPP
jgi:hypothetical protein